MTLSAWILSQTESFHAFLYVVGTRPSANLLRSNHLSSAPHALGSGLTAARHQPQDSTEEQSCLLPCPTHLLPPLCCAQAPSPWMFTQPHCPCVLSCFVYLNLTSPGDIGPTFSESSPPVLFLTVGFGPARINIGGDSDCQTHEGQV